MSESEPDGKKTWTINYKKLKRIKFILWPSDIELLLWHVIGKSLSWIWIDIENQMFPQLISILSYFRYGRIISTTNGPPDSTEYGEWDNLVGGSTKEESSRPSWSSDWSEVRLFGATIRWVLFLMPNKQNRRLSYYFLDPDTVRWDVISQYLYHDQERIYLLFYDLMYRRPIKIINVSVLL